MGESASRHALIIANDMYHDEGLKKLQAPAQDAVALAGVLGDPQIGGFDVEVVRNEPAHVISMHVDDFFSDRRPSDTLVLHFSCHGLKSESGELYFAASNTLPRRLASTAVPANFVRRCMTTTRARSIALFLDCCYGGAFSQGAASVRAAPDVNVIQSFVGEKLGSGRGWAVITASNAMEYAFEGTRLSEDSTAQPSVFTRAVVEGLATGEADLDEDGRVSLDELYEYVFDHVRQENPNQTPSRSVDMQGDMYLARSHRRRIAPFPVPEDVRAAMRSPDIYTRRGAIAELRARMENTDLSIAVGAREALEEMAHKDIRAVADEARQALSEVGINPYPTRLDFGPVPQHAPPPHRSVRLLGPPLARSCAPHPKRDWLRAQESPDGLDVRVDTATAGRLRGEIVLKGVVGEAVLHVEVEVVPTDEGTAPSDSAPSRSTPATGSAAAAQSPASATDRADPSPEVHDRPPPPPAHPKAAPPGTASPAHQPTMTATPPTAPTAPPTPTAATAPTAPTAHVTEPVSGTPPPPPPTSPPTRPPGHGTAATSETVHRPPRTALRAPALAAAALAAAIASVVTLVLAATAAVEAGNRRHELGGSLEEHVHDTHMLTPLIIALVTAVVTFVLGALARHDLGARPDRYTEPRTRATRVLTWTAKLLAIPALVLAALMGIAYLVAKQPL